MSGVIQDELLWFALPEWMRRQLRPLCYDTHGWWYRNEFDCNEESYPARASDEAMLAKIAQAEIVEEQRNENDHDQH